MGVHAAGLIERAAEDADLDAGLKEEVEERGDAPRNVLPPPRLAQTTQSRGGGVVVGVVSADGAVLKTLPSKKEWTR